MGGQQQLEEAQEDLIIIFSYSYYAHTRKDGRCQALHICMFCRHTITDWCRTESSNFLWHITAFAELTAELTLWTFMYDFNTERNVQNLFRSR